MTSSAVLAGCTREGSAFGPWFRIRPYFLPLSCYAFVAPQKKESPMRFWQLWIASLLAAQVGLAAAQAPARPIRIGYLMPFSGTEAQNGKDNQDGFNLYLASINNTVAG